MHNSSILIDSTIVPFTCAFKFIRVDWNPSCMILGTYVMNTRTGVRVDALLIGSVKVERFPVTRKNYRS
jgi:hypothetical protein